MNTNRTAAGLVACIAACGGLAACGSSSSSSSSGASATATSSAVASAGSAGFAAARAKLVTCLKQHGVTLPARPGGFRGRHYRPNSAAASGSPPAGGFPRGGFFGGRFSANPKLRAAFKACAADLPRRGPAFAGAARQAAITKFVICVRQHGYNLPKPNFSGKGSVFPAKIQSDPKFRSASRTCARLLIPRGARPGGPATPGAPPSA